MGFFAEFNIWLERVLRVFIADNTAAVAQILEPAIVTLGVLYVALWGYLQLRGKGGEPFLAGVKRLLTLALILGVSLQVWLYNDLIVDTFFNAPAQLGAQLLAASAPGAPSSAEPARVEPATVRILDELFVAG